MLYKYLYFKEGNRNERLASSTEWILKTETEKVMGLKYITVTKF